ncbi:probable serine serine/threonine-protein kinase nek3 isoform X5 [Octopus vulgaris]|uniref:Probable serine serine/threonine-protein kinase nek3 isoform X5 n=1 Tax=Octopus vulgaris TaxID=6645 RepID=A0AA36BDS2_OCTVU|nr:probable serine serine/threonine-protein kinase nek3 isoform X5 [Octopus vulgaris]
MSTPSQDPYPDKERVSSTELPMEERSQTRARPVPPVPERPASIRVSKHGQDKRDSSQLNTSATTQSKVPLARPIPPIPTKKPGKPPVPVCPPRPKVDGETSTNHRSVVGPDSSFDSVHSTHLPPDRPTPVTRKLSKHGAPPQRPNVPPVVKISSTFLSSSSSLPSSTSKTPLSRPQSVVPTVSSHENPLQSSASVDHCTKSHCPPPRPQPRTSISHSSSSSSEKLTCVTPPKPQPRKRVPSAAVNTPLPRNSSNNLNDNNNNTNINNNNNLNDVNNNVNSNAEELSAASTLLTTTSVDAPNTTDELIKDKSPPNSLSLAIHKASKNETSCNSEHQATSTVSLENSVSNLTADSHKALSSTPDPQFISPPKCATETASSVPVDLNQIATTDSFPHSQQNSDFPVPTPRLKQQLDTKPENNNDNFRTSPSEELCDFQLPSLEDPVSSKSCGKRPTIIRPVEKSDPVCSSEEPIGLSSGKRESLPRPSRPPLPANRNTLKNSSLRRPLPRPPPPIPKAEPVSTNESSFPAPLHGSSDLSAKPQPGMKKPSKSSESAKSPGTKGNEGSTKEPETKVDNASRLKNFFSRKGSTPSPPASDKKPVAAKNRKAAEMLQTTKDYTKRISETLGLTAEKPSAVWYTEQPPESEQQVKPPQKPPHKHPQKPPPKPPHKSQLGPTTWYVDPEESTRSQKKKKVPGRPPCSPLEMTKADDQQPLQTTDERDDSPQQESDRDSSGNRNSSNAFEKYHNSFKTSIENLSKSYEGSQTSLLDLDDKVHVDDKKILHPKSDILKRRPPEPPRPKSLPNSDLSKQPLQKHTCPAVAPPPKPKVPPQKQEIILDTPPSPVPKTSEIDSKNTNVALKETGDLEDTNVKSESSGVLDSINQFEHAPNSLISPPKSPKPVDDTSNICDNIKTTEMQPNQSETADVINTSQENLVCSDENENLTNVIQNETFNEMANNNFSSSKSNLTQETIELVDENANENAADSTTSGDLTEAELKIENSITKQSLPYNKMSNSLNTRSVNLIKDLKSSFEKSSLEGSTEDIEESSVTATADDSTREGESSVQEMLEHTDNVVQNSLEVEDSSSVIAEGLHERAVESLFDVKPNQAVESSSEVVQDTNKMNSGKDPEIKIKLKPKPQRPPSLPSSLCCTSVKASLKQDTQLPNVATGEVSAQTDKMSVVGKQKSSIADTARMKVTEPCAVAEFNFDAQEPDELSLKKGDRVRLLTWVDSSWLYGTCNGFSGIFPKGFVKIIQPLSNPPTPVNANSNSCGTDPDSVPAKENSNDATASDATEVMAFDNTLYASLSEVTTGTIAPTKLDSPALKDQEQINCDFLSPTQSQINFDEAHSQNDASNSLDDETTDSEVISKVDFPVGGEETIAITLYDFEGEEGELSFKAQQEVTVLKWVNNDWLWGRIGDKTGNLPANFVDFVADNSFEENLEPIDNLEPIEPLMNPPAPSTDTITDQLLTCVAKQLENVKQVKDYARARYDFAASTKDDLSFRKGDRIEVLEIGSDWAQGRHNKKVGYFPTGFVSFEEDLHNEDNEDDIAPTYEVVKALFDFKGIAEDELSFEAGDLIFCLGEVKSCPGWSQGTLNSQTGIFPTNFVSAPISNP